MRQAGDFISEMRRAGDLETPRHDGDRLRLRLLLDKLPKEQRLGTNLFLRVMGVAKFVEFVGDGVLLKAMFVVSETSCPGVLQCWEGLYLWVESIVN